MSLIKSATATLTGLLIGLLLQNCANDAALSHQEMLKKIVINQDRDALSEYITLDHRGFRSTIDSLIRSASTHFPPPDAADDSSVVASTVWLSAAYERATGIGDFNHRVKWLLSLGGAMRCRKAELDSMAALRAKAQPESANQTEADALLIDQFLEIGDTATAASGLLALAFSRYDAGDEAACLTSAERAERLCRSWDLGEILGDVLFLKSKVLSEGDGNYFEAMSHSYEAFACFERFGYREKLPFMRLQLGHSLFLLGFAQQAVNHFEAAATAFSVAGDKRFAGYAYYYLAEASYDLGLLDSALSYVDRAVLLRQQVASSLGANTLADVAYARSTRGIIHQARKSYREASSELNVAQRLFETSGNRDGSITNTFRRAALHLDLKRFAEADALFDTVLAHAGDFQERLFARSGQALSKYYLGDLEAAQSLAIECRDTLETARDLVLQPDLSVGFLSDKIGVYNLLVRIYLDRYQQTAQATMLDSALQVLESSKAQSLKSELTEKRESQGPRGAVGSQGERDSFDQEGTVDALRLRSSLAHSLDDSLRLAQLLRLQNGNRAELKGRELSQPETSRPVSAGTAAILVYYASELGAGIFLKLADTLGFIPIEIPLDSLEHLSRDFITAISSYPLQSRLPQSALQCGQELCRTLIPVDWLQERGCERLIIITSSPLAGLPFAAMILPESSFVAERFEVSYAPSIALLENLRPHPLQSDHGRVLAVGDPVITPETNSRLHYVLGTRMELRTLQFAAAELDALREVLGADRTLVIAGTEAQESAFESTDLSDIEILHFATHGLVNATNPLLSTLVMSPEPDKCRDGLLTAAEIADLELSGKGVVLSACQTATGVQYQGEGVYSIARAFIAGGASCVLATLWGVDDRSTVEITRSYYHYLLTGVAPVAALTEAQRAMINSPRQLYRHPYFWAPYICIGGHEVFRL